MKNKVLTATILLLGLVSLTSCFSLNNLSNDTTPSESTHEHTYSNWIVVEEATETTKGSKKRICSVCNYEESVEIDVLPHTHKYETTWSYDETKHWYQDTCSHDVKSDEGNHTMVDGICSVCGYKEPTKNLIYRLNDDHNSYSVTGVDNNINLSGEVVIASTYEGKPVTRIGCVFQHCSSLTSVTIPDSVTSIVSNAFQYCSSLTSVTIPDSVTSIGSNAFYGCRSLTSIVIPQGIPRIENYTFYNCSSLTSVTIPDSVTSIGSNAFNGCSSLTSIVIPQGIPRIEDSAFDGCSSLTSVTIPDSVISIGSNAFYDCSSLTSIIIPDSVTSIGNSAFYNCKNLIWVYFERTVSDFAFDCNAIKLDSKTIYYYSKTQPTNTKYNYWHYVDGKPTRWKNISL